MVYEGYWKDDRLNGFGVYHWANGDIEFGNWTNGQRSGEIFYV